jgi:transcription antitermination factor NusG
MQKNWYIIYTKTKCEKKVATILTKKGIENYFPLNCKEIKSFRKTKIHREPLFSAYVFAYISENEMEKAMEIDGVVNFVYWRGAPAIVQEDEIDAIRNFTTNHHDIRLEKAQINQEKPIKVADGLRYSMDGNILTIKNQSAKVNLPSIGFTMIAHVDSESMLGREVSFGNKQLSLQ